MKELIGPWNAQSNAEPKEDYSDLAPNQRRKKLQQRLDEINTRILQETATRDGLMKMKGVYEQNRALGDPLSIEGQLTESGVRSAVSSLVFLYLFFLPSVGSWLCRFRSTSTGPSRRLDWFQLP